jgi:hypothetical protein
LFYHRQLENFDRFSVIFFLKIHPEKMEHRREKWLNLMVKLAKPKKKCAENFTLAINIKIKCLI